MNGFLSSGILASLLILAGPAVHAASVTPDRLLNAANEPQNWLMNLGDYSGRRFSGLGQINRENVDRLVVRYSVALGGLVEGGGNFIAATPLSPLVEDGAIFIVDGWGKVSKLDARDQGALLWESEAGQRNLDAWLQASRGLALYRDWVISAGADGQLHWIEAETGTITRSIQVADPASGYTIAAPPLVIGDTIIVAGGGADRAIPGRLDAIDARTGEPLWQTEAPSGSASFLQSGLFDPDTGLTIWSAGDPDPWADWTSPPGEDAFTNSTIALDVESGTIRWRFRYTPDGSHGFSEAGANHLVALGDADAGAKGLSHFGNNGFHYVLDAADGSFLSATPHVEGIEWTSGIDPESGRPVDPEPEPALWADTPGCPNIRSVAAFAPAYSPRTGLSYGAGADGCHPDVGIGKTASTGGWHGAYYAGAANSVGYISAVDPATGKVAAQRLMDFPLHSGVLATDGGLIFTTTADGTLHALHDETLETVWSQKFATLSPVPPVTFEVDGEQFIALVIGGNALANDLSYRPPEMGITDALFILVVLGMPS